MTVAPCDSAGMIASLQDLILIPKKIETTTHTLDVIPMSTGLHSDRRCKGVNILKAE
jgi:hypothetical protein